MRTSAQWAILAVGILACVTGCTPAATRPPSSPAGSGPTPSTAGPSHAASAALTVLGAASLKGALEEVAVRYQAANPGTTLTFSTDSSAALETQIEQGAPADVFLSADDTNPRKLVDAGLAAGPAMAFAANRLAIIVPATNPGALTTPADLARPGVKVIAAAASVPITGYATRLVANLAGLAGYPERFAAAYAANVVSREDNVKAIVAKIELAEGDAGIVYVTDGLASAKVQTIEVPAAANVAATYAGVVLKASPNRAAASAFLDWLAGPDGRAIFSTFGFQPPS